LYTFRNVKFEEIVRKEAWGDEGSRDQGCGMTKFGRLEGKGLMDLLTEASLRAIEDAGASECDFDSVYVGNI